MTTFKHLLVATDFSKASEAGIRTARDLAGQLGARVSVVHVCEEILLPMIFTTEEQRTEFHEESLKVSRERLDACIHEHFGDLPAEARLRYGSPAAEIVACAREVEADLVVLASHGRGSVGQLVFGSTAQRVIHSAPCPTVVVRPQEDTAS
ncbi:MAG: universal stress protein [Acidobacteria bacterium]|nr:universal stress protein [Acidobacteriota bacterium]